MINSDNDKQSYIVNIKLAKYLGLYQIINPNSSKVYGYNVYNLVLILILVYMVTMLGCLMAGLYYWINNMDQIIMLLEIIINSSFMAYKGVVIIRYSTEIWDVLDLTRIDFMKYGCHDRSVLKNCRRKSLLITNVYAILCYCIYFSWVLLPFIFTPTYLYLKERDGTLGKYRINTYNLFFLVSDVTYNTYFRVFQFLETFYGLCAIHFSIVFDTLLIAICFSLSSQLETLKSTYSSLGHTPKRVLYDDDIVFKEVNRVKPVTSDDLQMIISDHQAIIKKMEQFYKIVRSVILSQLVVSSNTQIFMTYIIALNFMNSTGLRSVETTKMLCATPIFSIQLYLTCLLFGNINKQKNEINFALYSSDWTSMDLKCRKLVLFALRMNNANRLTMSVTETKIVNLEMFKNVLHMSYSVFSVLVNSNTP